MKFNKLHLISASILILIFCSLATSDERRTTISDWQAYQKSGHKDPKWDSFVEAGFSAFESGNMGSAEMFLQRAIARGCNDGLVYAKIGLFYEAQSNYKKAAVFFQKAAKRLASQYPGYETTILIDEFLGRVLYLSGNTNEAFSHLEKAFTRHETFTSAYFLGLIYKSRGEIDKASGYFEKALSSPRPKDLPVGIDILIMTELGKAYYDMKNFDRSLDWWNTILSIDPANAAAQSYRSDIERQKYKEQERKVLEEIVK